MSHLNEMKTRIKSKEALIAALCRMGFNKNQIEIHEKAKLINGYHGAEDAKIGHVIIRSQNARIPSDIGWELGKDGFYVGHLDAFDYSNSAWGSRGGGFSVRYDQIWENKLNTYANIEASKIAGLANGIEYTETTDQKGRIQLIGKFLVANKSRVQTHRA